LTRGHPRQQPYSELVTTAWRNDDSRSSVDRRAVAVRNPRDPAPIFDRRLRHRARIATPRPSASAPRAATLTPDRRHVLAITTHGLAALASGHPRLIGRPLVRRTFRMRSTTTLAGDLALAIAIHRGESAIARAAALRRSVRTTVVVLYLAIALFRHSDLPSRLPVLWFMPNALRRKRSTIRGTLTFLVKIPHGRAPFKSGP
jgi:hypothetical protein